MRVNIYLPHNTALSQAQLEDLTRQAVLAVEKALPRLAGRKSYTISVDISQATLQPDQVMSVNCASKTFGAHRDKIIKGLKDLFSQIV